MRRGPLTVDIAIALAAMIILVIVSPGLAVVGLIALLVLLLCGLTVLFEIRRARRRPRPRAARTPPSRRPPPPRGARRL